MPELLKGIGKLIAVLFAGLFVIVTGLGLLLLSIEGQLFNPDFYLGVLEDQGIYDRLPGITAEQLTYSMGFDPCLENPESCEGGQVQAEPSGSAPGYFQVLTKNDWELLITRLLPLDWLKGQVQSVIEQVFDYIETGVGEFSITLSMGELKESLSGEAGINAIARLLEAQPDCSSDDLIEMIRILQGAGEPGKDFLRCNPPANFIEERTPQLEVMLRRSLREMPDEIDLASGLFGGNREVGSQLSTVTVFDYPLTGFMLLNWIRWAIRMIPLLSLLLLLVIAFFAAGSFRNLRGWWGIPLTITGIIGLAFALAATPLSNWVIDTFIAGQRVAGISPSLFDAGADLLGQLIQSLFVRLRNLALILTILGLGIALLPRLFDTLRPKDEPTPQNP
jgi:hypothetical protein